MERRGRRIPPDACRGPPRSGGHETLSSRPRRGRSRRAPPDSAPPSRRPPRPGGPKARSDTRSAPPAGALPSRRDRPRGKYNGFPRRPSREGRLMFLVDVRQVSRGGSTSSSKCFGRGAGDPQEDGRSAGEALREHPAPRSGSQRRAGRRSWIRGLASRSVTLPTRGSTLPTRGSQVSTRSVEFTTRGSRTAQVGSESPQIGSGALPRGS